MFKVKHKFEKCQEIKKINSQRMYRDLKGGKENKFEDNI